VRECASVAELLKRSDVAVITTPWPEFADLPLGALDGDPERRVVVDCWGILSKDLSGKAIKIVRLGRTLDDQHTAQTQP
jgi:hypothetical protein